MEFCGQVFTQAGCYVNTDLFVRHARDDVKRVAILGHRFGLEKFVEFCHT